MDINDTPLSRLKTNKAGISRTVSENRALAEAAKSKEVSSGTSPQNMKQPDLREGQLVKGQIIDHRYNEIKIQLEPGKQVISARLSGDVPLTIGQEAHFQVTEGSADRLVLKYIPEEAAPADTTIQKALTASGLPLTERNKAIVSELLNQRMPVDKQTLQNLIRLSVTNREASPQTLVLMYKNQIPMTPANIRQFEAYQTGTNQLLQDIKAISHNIFDILLQPEAPSADVSSLEQKVTGLIPDESIDHTLRQSDLGQASDSLFKYALQMNGKLIAVLTDTAGKLSSSPAAIEAKIADYSSSIPGIVQEPSGPDGTQSGIFSGLSAQTNLLQGNYGQIDLTSALNGQANLASAFKEQANLTSVLAEQISKGNLSSGETLKLLIRLYTENSDNQQSLQLQDVLNQLRDQVQTDPATTQVISKLLEHFNQFKGPGAVTLADILDQSKRSALSGLLSGDEGTENCKEQILKGNLSLKDTLTLLQEGLTRMEKADAYKLLQSSEYTKLLEEAFLEKWTVSPEKIAKKHPVSDLYNQMREDLDKLSALVKSGSESDQILRFQEPVKNLQDNLQFMKDLNEVFTFLPLPVRLKDREAHADLYVFTRKKALNDKRENLSVLLHLDMENLGSLNVHIQMNPNNKIQADFYLEDSEAGRLIKENLPSLTAGLQKKGYSIQAEVKASYKKPDFSRDFIEQSMPDHDIRRYTFDIRT